MIKKIQEYACHHNLPFKASFGIANKEIDVLINDNDVHKIIEVKSGDNSWYQAVGQLLIYETLYLYENSVDTKKIIIAKSTPDNFIKSALVKNNIEVLKFSKFKLLWEETK